METENTTGWPDRLGRAAAAVVGLGMLTTGIAGPAGAAPRGHVPVDVGVGFFYQTFGQDPDLMLLAGGTATEFCDDVGPDGDPFAEAEPGKASARLFFRDDGSVDVKVNDKDQAIHLYEIDQPAPFWIADFCDDYFGGDAVPDPFASGTADVKIRVSEGADGVVDVFNSVNGKAAGPDGTAYKVRASADLVVENGEPVGNPEDFVDLELQEIGR